MTIRSRNKITFVFTIFAFVIFLLELLLILYALVYRKISFPEVQVSKNLAFFLFSYKPLAVIFAILLQSFYSFFSSYCTFKNFQKTQSTEIVYFLIFLLSTLCDSGRILLPIFYTSQSYSNFLIAVGNISLFARILSPLALFGISFLSSEEYRQDLERNCLIIIVVSLFFASFIPINTSIISGNFAISYGYRPIIRSYAVILNIISSITLLVNSIKKEYNIFMPIGFCMVTSGYGLVYTSYNIALLSTGFLLMGSGTIIYLVQLHRHYLWTD